jgi:hypothetical protein
LDEELTALRAKTGAAFNRFGDDFAQQAIEKISEEIQASGRSFDVGRRR